MKTIFFYITFLTLFSFCLCQNFQSPCPGLFSYDPEGVLGNKWSGTINIVPENEYTGLWIRVIFSRPIMELSTIFGEVVRRENNEFLIKKPKQIFSTGQSIQIRITVTFDTNFSVPEIIGFRQNGRVVCPENGVIQTANSNNNLVSPCPRFFSYELSNTETDKWYGLIDLKSDRELSGVWLRIILDRPSIQLGNWFGEVTTDDNKEYLIKNRQIKLKAGENIPVRFFVKYNPVETIPKLERFRLNAIDLCPENEGTLSNIPTRVQTTTQKNFNSPNWVKPDLGPKADETIFGSDFDPQSRPVFLPNKGSQPNYQCGVVASQPRPLITHGVPTLEGQFPWHAALYYPKGIDLQYICGASLITLRHVISAAHCVTKKSTNTPVQNDDIEVYLGKHHLRKFSGRSIQNTQVTEINVHPEYNYRYYANDISILKLSSNVEYTDYVRPVCLWTDSIDINSIIDKPGIVVGWGYDHTGKVTETLTKAQMPVVSQLTCIRSYPEFFSKFAHEKTVCAGFRNGTSVCNGDSGGGLVFPQSDLTPGQTVYQLRGVVSISVALQSEFICDTSHYAIFTDVAKYLDWIKEHIL